jgi:threonine dehydrogenase-like Zn-dependent dehydrogenase
MKAIAVFPGKANSVYLADLKKPLVNDFAEGRGVLVRLLRVGVDGTDKEINAGEYGDAPQNFDFLLVGHESFGIVEEVGRVSPALSPVKLSNHNGAIKVFCEVGTI